LSSWTISEVTEAIPPPAHPLNSAKLFLPAKYWQSAFLTLHAACVAYAVAFKEAGGNIRLVDLPDASPAIRTWS